MLTLDKFMGRDYCFTDATAETDAMKRLHQQGWVISDNCIDWSDVGNQEEALKWLRANGGIDNDV